MRKFLIKPVAGKHVRDPQSKKILPPEGISTNALDSYWHRRQQDGDVVISENKPAPKAAKPAVKAQPKAQEA